MPIYAVIGADGTGKSTLLSEIGRIKPEWSQRSEFTRSLAPILGYSSPWGIVNDCGIAFYEALMIASWSNLGELDRARVYISDRSPLDNYCYYITIRSAVEGIFEKPLFNLAMHYAKMIDYYFLIPCGVFPFCADDMREVDVQRQFEDNMYRILADEGVKYHTISASSVIARADEVIKHIEALSIQCNAPTEANPTLTKGAVSLMVVK